MNDKLIILAGGLSSRMKLSSEIDQSADMRLIDEADSKSKAMLGIGDNRRPFLDYLLFNAREAGYWNIVIVIGEKDDSIKNYYGRKDSDNDFKGLKISFAVQPIPAGRVKPLGTADALLHALHVKHEWSGQKFTICNSDNLYSTKALKLMSETPYPNAMIEYDREGLEFERERIESFSVTKKDDKGFLIDIIEKPTKDEVEAAKGKDGVTGVSMNIFCLSYNMILPYLKTIPLHPVRGEKELPIAVKMMINENPKSLFAYTIREHVPDLTSKRDIISVQKYLKKEFPNFSF